MKLNKKLLALAIVCLATLVFSVGCSHKPLQHEINNSENYTVSVKYDANGGNFTTNTPVIVHTYNIEGLETNDDGLVEIPLVTPDNEEAGNKKFVPKRNGYFFAGWYKTCIETPGANGDTNLTYSDMWDFENDRYKVDPKKEFTSENAELTLYAAWIPLFEINYYDISTGELLEKKKFNPLADNTFTLPTTNEKTGGMKSNDFPEKEGYTFKNAYLSEDMSNGSLVTDAEITHPGSVNFTTATAENPSFDVYVDWVEGEWYKITTPAQFIKSSDENGHYEILADLDFEGSSWKFDYMDFSGEIVGNGHTFKNITVTHEKTSNTSAGLFPTISEGARISDVIFENITFNIAADIKDAGASFGILAGTISNGAEISNVKLVNSTMTIDSSCEFISEDYSIGLVCGSGDDSAIVAENVSCVPAGEKTETVTITVSGNTVTVKIG